MHTVSIISLNNAGSPALRFEVRLGTFDMTMSRRLRKMGFGYFGRGLFIKELLNPEEMKDRYLFNMEFLNRTFNKNNIKHYSYMPIAS